MPESRSRRLAVSPEKPVAAQAQNCPKPSVSSTSGAANRAAGYRESHPACSAEHVSQVGRTPYRPVRLTSTQKQPVVPNGYPHLDKIPANDPRLADNDGQKRRPRTGSCGSYVLVAYGVTSLYRRSDILGCHRSIVSPAMISLRRRSLGAATYLQGPGQATPPTSDLAMSGAKRSAGSAPLYPEDLPDIPNRLAQE